MFAPNDGTIRVHTDCSTNALVLEAYRRGRKSKETPEEVRDLLSQQYRRGQKSKGPSFPAVGFGEDPHNPKESPEEVKDLLFEQVEPALKIDGLPLIKIDHANKRLIEAYRRGQKSKETK